MANTDHKKSIYGQAFVKAVLLGYRPVGVLCGANCGSSGLVELEVRAGKGGGRVDAFLAFGLIPVPCLTCQGGISGNLLDACHTTDKGGDGQGPYEAEDIFNGKNRRYRRLDGDFRATPALVPSEETSVGQRFHGQHADARLHALGRHVGDEALVVGVGGG